MPETSVLTIAAGRAAHLRNVVRGLAAQTVPPRELVVGVMQDDPYDDLPETGFPIRQVHVRRADGQLPLAAARNAVAAAAAGEVLAFVDVDCIPAPEFVADVTRAVGLRGGLVMGEVMYLPEGAADDGPDWPLFERLAERHSDRGAPPRKPLARCDDYRCFWSLNFALTRADWDRSGGFDERYFGYGGEDTDYGRTLEARGIPIWWARGARVYHQYHAHCMPPIHHMRSVLRNTEVFRDKWGERTMGHWLHGFRLMGLIDEIDGELVVLREPNEADFALCRQKPERPYANTRRVLDILQADEARGLSNRERTAQVAAAEAALAGSSASAT